MALAYGQEVPIELLRWNLAEHFGWTLDAVDALSIQDWHEWENVKDGRGKARGSIRNKHGNQNR